MKAVIGETLYEFVPAIVSPKMRSIAIQSGIEVDLMQPVDEVMTTNSGEIVYAIHGQTLLTESKLKGILEGILDD